LLALEPAVARSLEFAPRSAVAKRVAVRLLPRWWVRPRPFGPPDVILAGPKLARLLPRSLALPLPWPLTLLLWWLLAPLLLRAIAPRLSGPLALVVPRAITPFLSWPVGFMASFGPSWPPFVASVLPWLAFVPSRFGGTGAALRLAVVGPPVALSLESRLALRARRQRVAMWSLARPIAIVLARPPRVSVRLVARFLRVLEPLPRIAMLAARPPVTAAALAVFA
jgi:hypothetical protein